MARDRDWDAAPSALGPRVHRQPGESNQDALARMAGERDAAIRDRDALAAQLRDLTGITLPNGRGITLRTADGDTLTAVDHGDRLEAHLRAPMNGQRGIVLDALAARVLAGWAASRFLLQPARRPPPAPASALRIPTDEERPFWCRVCGAGTATPTRDGGPRYFMSPDQCRPCARGEDPRPPEPTGPHGTRTGLPVVGSAPSGGACRCTGPTHDTGCIRRGSR